MSVMGGLWDSAKWGASMWDVAQNCISVDGTLISDSLKKVITQETPNAQRIYASVLIDGIELAQLCTAIEVTESADSTFSYARLTIAAAAIAGLQLGSSTVVISHYFELADGSAFGRQVFSGIVSEVRPSQTLAAKTFSITAKHDLETALYGTPLHTTRWPAATTGIAAMTARNLILSELADAGITTCDVTMDDFTPIDRYVITLSFDTKIALIRAIASAQTPALVYADACGLFRVLPVLMAVDPTWEIGKAGLIAYDEADDSGVFNSVTVMGRHWIMASNGFVNEPITSTYTDSSDVASRGRTIAGTSVTTNYLHTQAEIDTLSESLVKVALLKRATFQTPTNPFLRIGDTVQIMTDDGARNVKITGITKTFSWEGNAGAWDDMTGLVMPS